MIDRKIIKDKYLKLENTYSELPGVLFSKVELERVKAPKLVAFNEGLAKELGLNEEFLKSLDGIELLGGNSIIEETTPIAQAYAGHQFGHFTMLGDGRAVLLGEYVTENGERFDIQLKGGGRTPYSRGGDGKAALGPMLREYIISEGVNGLGISTTRSLAVVETGESVIREEVLKGAVLTRVAKSHIRVGTFQFASQWGSLDDLKELADYTIERHFKRDEYPETKYLYLLNEVVKKQGELISKWNLVGFIHGVMNTDNMVISGESIDYGPCAFMDTYNVDTVFSSIDVYGRYAYKNQPQIGMWNLARFAETLLPLLNENREEAVKLAQKAIESFKNIYEENWFSGMRRKLGLFNEEEGDKILIDSLLSLMGKYKADYTNTFCDLTLGKLKDEEMYSSEDFKKWYGLWMEKRGAQGYSLEESRKLMEKNNPTVIPRNFRVEESLSAAVNNSDYSVMEGLLEAIRNPYDYENIRNEYRKVPKDSGVRYKTYCGT